MVLVSVTQYKPMSCNNEQVPVPGKDEINFVTHCG